MSTPQTTPVVTSGILIPARPATEFYKDFVEHQIEAADICLGTMARANKHWLDFMSSRGHEVAHFQERLMGCKSPGDLANLVTDHSRSALTAYQTEWTDLVRIGLAMTRAASLAAVPVPRNTQSLSPSV